MHNIFFGSFVKFFRRVLLMLFVLRRLRVSKDWIHFFVEFREMFYVSMSGVIYLKLCFHFIRYIALIFMQISFFLFQVSRG